MNKEKALKSLEFKINSTKETIEELQNKKQYQNLIYLNGRLEALEGIMDSIKNGQWD